MNELEGMIETQLLNYVPRYSDLLLSMGPGTKKSLLTGKDLQNVF